MSDVNAAPAPEPAAIAAPTPEVAATPEDTMASVYEKHYPDARVDRAKDSGQFKSKNPEPVKAEGAVEAEPAQEINQEPIDTKPEPDKPVIAAPQSWSADKKALFDTLSPEAKEYILQRESEVQKGQSQLGQKASLADKYENVLTRYKHVLTDAPEREIETLLATKEAFQRNPVATFEHLARQLGIDLSRYGQAQNGEQPAENEQIRSLTQTVAQLQRKLDETHNHLSARERSEQQSREQTLVNLVNDFSKDKDYWPDIESDVMAQIIAIKSATPDKDPKEVLKEAHDRALKLNDEISNKLTEAKRKKEAADKAAEEKRKAEEAKRLASLNTKSSSGTTPRAAKSIDAELEEIYDKVAARG